MKFNLKFRLFLATTLCVVFLDQGTKLFINNLKPTISFLFFQIQYTQNTGAAFGIFQNSTAILALISTIAIGLILFIYPKLFDEPRIVHFFWGLFLGGTIGNALDRIFRNYVIDFIGTTFWPSFNIADSAITIAVIGIVGYWIYEEIKNKNNKN